MCTPQISLHWKMLSYQYGPTFLKNAFSTLLNQCHVELRQFWRWVELRQFWRRNGVKNEELFTPIKNVTSYCSICQFFVVVKSALNESCNGFTSILWHISEWKNYQTAGFDFIPRLQHLTHFPLTGLWNVIIASDIKSYHKKSKLHFD